MCHIEMGVTLPPFHLFSQLIQQNHTWGGMSGLIYIIVLSYFSELELVTDNLFLHHCVYFVGGGAKIQNDSFEKLRVDSNI